MSIITISPRPRLTSFLNGTVNYLESATDASLGYPLDGNRLVQQWMWFSVNTSGAGSVANLVTDDLTKLTETQERLSKAPLPAASDLYQLGAASIARLPWG